MTIEEKEKELDVTRTVETPCGGQIKVTVSKQYSTVNCKFENIVIGNICQTCPYEIFCRNNFLQGAKPKKPPVERRVPDKTVKVVAFTGMRIGELEVVKETATSIEVATVRGIIIVFDKATGIQTNCLNPKYANRIVSEFPPLPVKGEQHDASRFVVPIYDWFARHSVRDLCQA